MRSSSAVFDRGAPLTPAAFSPVSSTNEVELAVWQLAGADTDRPLLLAHATGFHALVWAPLARQLDGYRVLAPDLRGHGDSNAPVGRGMDWNGFADDILAVVDAMRAAGIDTDGLVAAGHSKGGASLLLAEERRPGTFGAIYCYEPVVMPADFAPPTGADNPLSQSALRRRDTFESRREAYDNYAGKLPFSALDPDALGAYVQHGFADDEDGSVRLKCRPEIEAAVYGMGGEHDAYDHLQEIACPVTIAAGAVSGFGPAAFARQVTDRLPHGTLAEFPDLGHFGPLEDPTAVATSIKAAFATV